MFIKRIQVGLLHTAVAITLVPLNSTLNRIMIKELGIAATVVALLASIPYLFSPIQVAIGAISDRFPLFGYRRTPYIVFGLLLCVIGVGVSPYMAFSLPSNMGWGLVFTILIFGAWGMGFNFASVSYFALAYDFSGEKGRSKTIATMFFLMIVGIILTSISLGRLLETYSEEAVIQAFWIVGGVALFLGVLGLVGLEERVQPENNLPSDETQSSKTTHYSWKDMVKEITGNRQATRFFWYLILLLTAILGQDVLLEPYGAEAFGMTVDTTSRITSIWGISFLLSLVGAGFLENRVSRLSIAKIGGLGAIIAFPTIILSGSIGSTSVFYLGVVLLGLATGLATVSNLALMLDMTTVEKAGLFIGAWGMASALARFGGNVISGILRDSINAFTTLAIPGYQATFALETVMLIVSLMILRQVDVRIFKTRAGGENLSLIERASIAGEI